MLFDFKETYASFTNEALVKIIANPSGYQPEAVAAAKTILEERGITTKELDEMLYPPQPEVAIVSGNLIRYEDGKTNVFGEMLQRKLPPSVKRKIKIISIWLGVNAVYVLFTRYYFKIKYYNPETRIIYSMEFMTLLTMGFPFFIIYLLHRPKPINKAWLVALCYSCYCLLHVCLNIYRYANREYLYATAIDIGWLIYVSGMHATVLTLLFQYDFRRAFPVTNKAITQGLLATLLIFLFDVFMGYITFGSV